MKAENSFVGRRKFENEFNKLMLVILARITGNENSFKFE